MSLIACTNDCLYQQDGYCALERAVTSSLPLTSSGQCVNFVRRNASNQDGQGLPDVFYPNEL